MPSGSSTVLHFDLRRIPADATEQYREKVDYGLAEAQRRKLVQMSSSLAIPRRILGMCFREIATKSLILNPEPYRIMMNKRTTALMTKQYIEIITTMKEGGTGFRPNERMATALVLEGNLGLRISDIVRLRLSDIVNDGGRYRLAITEQKTGKQCRLRSERKIYTFLTPVT